MPATIEIPTTRPGRTLTLSAFPDGSDTAAFTEVALTEASNRPGVYSYSNSTATGLHMLILYEETAPVWQAWAMLATSGTIVACETRDAALISSKLPTSTYLAGSANPDGSTDPISQEQLEQIATQIGDLISGLAISVKDFQQTALAQIAGTRSIYASVPTLKGNSLSAPLIQGDTYAHEIGSAIEFSRSDFPDLPEGATCRLTARKCEDGSSVSFVMEGTIPVREGAKVCRLEATSEQSRAWEPGTYEFDVQVTWPDGKTRTFVGPGIFLTVISDVTAS